MIDRKQLDSHPANLLAVELLRELKGVPDRQQVPLLTLAQVYLNSLSPEALREGYTADLRQQAYELNLQPQDWVASLFVEDREQLLLDLAEADRAWPVLKEHLDGLYQAMRKEKDVQAVGNLLAHGLFSNLQEVFPGFGPQSQ